MKQTTFLVSLAVLTVVSPMGLASQVVLASKVTPVQKVIQMMIDMKVKGESNKAAEQQSFAVYSEWVKGTTKDLGFQIQTSNAQIEQLTAFIQKANADAAARGSKLQALRAEIERLDTEKNDATEERESEHKEFEAASKDLTESVDALGQAIQTLTAQNYDRKTAEVLLQRMASTVPGMPRVLAAYLQESAAAHQPGAPEVAAYEFQSQSIIDVLEKLEAKFKSELDAVMDDEGERAHNYALAALHLTNAIAHTSKDAEANAAEKARLTAASAKAQGELASTRAELAADQKFLADMQATFGAKTATYNANQEVRQQELDAIRQAIDIISSPNVAVSYGRHVKLAQVASEAASFLQTQSSKSRVVARRRVTELLRRRATLLSSKVLASFADKVAANPFSKIITMIEDLISRLKEEALAEADHKAWCDSELKTNKEKRNDKTADVQKLTAEVAELASSIEVLGREIATLVEEQQALGSAMEKATDERTKDRSTNTATIADAQAGSKAVEQAVVILRAFYESQAALVQSGAKQVPELEEYNGMHERKDGVVGILEVIATDFARLEAETQAAEEQAAREHAEFMSDAKANKKAKHDREVSLSLEKDQDEFEKHRMVKDLAAVSDELAAAKTYFEYLKPNCLQVHVSYEERVARRDEEIKALKEAYAILDQKGE